MSTDRESVIDDKAVAEMIEQMQIECDASFDAQKVSDITVYQLRTIIRDEIGKAKEDK